MSVWVVVLGDGHEEDKHLEDWLSQWRQDLEEEGFEDEEDEVSLSTTLYVPSTLHN